MFGKRCARDAFATGGNVFRTIRKIDHFRRPTTNKRCKPEFRPRPAALPQIAVPPDSGDGVGLRVVGSGGVAAEELCVDESGAAERGCGEHGAAEARSAQIRPFKPRARQVQVADHPSGKLGLFEPYASRRGSAHSAFVQLQPEGESEFRNLLVVSVFENRGEPFDVRAAFPRIGGEHVGHEVERLFRRHVHRQILRLELPRRERIDQKSRKKILLQRGVGERKVVLLLADDEGRRAQVFLERFAVHVGVGVLDHRIPVKPQVEPVVEVVRLQPLTAAPVDFGGQRLHEPLFVRRAELVLALVPRQPVLHRHVVQRGRVDVAALGDLALDVGNRLRDQVERVGA